MSVESAEVAIGEESRPKLAYPLVGYMSDCETWRDTEDFDYSSSHGYYFSEEENHVNTVLIAFGNGLVRDHDYIRHVRHFHNRRYVSSVIIIENDASPEPVPAASDKPNVEQFSLQLREELQDQFDMHAIQHSVTRIFRVRQQNDKPQKKTVEYLGFEYKPKEFTFQEIDAAVSEGREMFASVFDEYQHRIRKYISRVLYKAGRSDNLWIGADDIVQEVFEQAYRSRKRFTKYENIPLSAWFFRIAANITSDHLRRGHFGRMSTLPADWEKQPATTMNEDLILELQVVSHMVEGLTPRQQQILALTSLGYSTAESAWMLNLPSVNTLKVTQHTGRIRLRQMDIWPEERKLGEFYIIWLAHRMLLSKVSRDTPFWQEGQLESTVAQSLKRMGFSKKTVLDGIHSLPEGFFDRLANTYTVPRENKLPHNSTEVD